MGQNTQNRDQRLLIDSVYLPNSLLRVSDIVSSTSGRPQYTQRVDLAHGMDKASTITQMYSLNRSIWMLAFRLLLESGVPAEQLAIATRQSERFRTDDSRWKEHWPA